MIGCWKYWVDKIFGFPISYFLRPCVLSWSVRCFSSFFRVNGAKNGSLYYIIDMFSSHCFCSILIYILNILNLECFSSLVAETSTGCLLGGSSLGRRELRPDEVGQAAAEELCKNLDNNACVDSFAQDQVIIYFFYLLVIYNEFISYFLNTRNKNDQLTN